MSWQKVLKEKSYDSQPRYEIKQNVVRGKDLLSKLNQAIPEMIKKIETFEKNLDNPSDFFTPKRAEWENTNEGLLGVKVRIKSLIRQIYYLNKHAKELEEIGENLEYYVSTVLQEELQ